MNEQLSTPYRDMVLRSKLPRLSYNKVNEHAEAVQDVMRDQGAPYNSRPGHKTGGTSQEAAEAMQGRAANLRERCLGMIKVHGLLTADDCAAFLGETVLAVRPRFTELLQQGLIRDTGTRRKNASGRRARVWEVAA